MANERSSGTAFFSSKDEKSVLAGAHDYFVNNVLPSDIKACVRKIKAPTLLIVGDKDPYVSVALCEEAKATLKAEGSQLKVIPGASHPMMMEKPYYKAFREAVLDFLK